jgi:psp operon transcriptional activator
VLERYDWPGNVRELRNTVERAVYRWQDETRAIDDIDFDPFDSPWMPKGTPAAKTAEVIPALPSPANVNPARHIGDVRDLRAAVAEYERDILAEALRRCRYNQRAAAKAVSLSYDQLRHAMKRHGLFENEAQEKAG